MCSRVRVEFSGRRHRCHSVHTAELLYTNAAESITIIMMGKEKVENGKQTSSPSVHLFVWPVCRCLERVVPRYGTRSEQASFRYAMEWKTEPV